MDIADIRPSMELVWNYTPRGGYGFSYPVTVVVKSVGRKRVRCEATLARGGTRLVNVSPEKLRLPQTP